MGSVAFKLKKKMLSDDFEKKCEEQNQVNMWDRGTTKRGERWGQRPRGRSILVGRVVRRQDDWVCEQREMRLNRNSGLNHAGPCRSW